MMKRIGAADLIACAEDAGSPSYRTRLPRSRLRLCGGERARLSGNVVIINSFSKYYCMTGWRIAGWWCRRSVRAIERLQQNLAVSVPTLSQIAAQALRRPAELEAVKRAMRRTGAF